MSSAVSNEQFNQLQQFVEHRNSTTGLIGAFEYSAELLECFDVAIRNAWQNLVSNPQHQEALRYFLLTYDIRRQCGWLSEAKGVELNNDAIGLRMSLEEIIYHLGEYASAGHQAGVIRKASAITISPPIEEHEEQLKSIAQLPLPKSFLDWGLSRLAALGERRGISFDDLLKDSNNQLEQFLADAIIGYYNNAHGAGYSGDPW